jgi:NADH-quinone oxidoreductase subunit L
MLETAFLIPLLSLISFVLIIFFGRRLPGKGSYVAIGAVGWGLFHSLWIFLTVLLTEDFQPLDYPLYDFFKLSENSASIIEVAYRIDGLTAVMLMVVTIVSFLVQVYSLGYMGYKTPHEDVRFSRFYAYLSLFTFSMLVLVMANNYAVLFVAWELVGLCSYLLIGHWFEKDYPDPRQITPREAGLKAFITTKLGDLGLVVGLMGLFALCSTVLPGKATFNMQQVESAVRMGLGTDAFPAWALTLVCILMFFGAVGKSAQFPLHTWLPDAMEGPTPVSALIHAATMVAAGVYLVARIFPILTPDAGWFIAYVGGFTALFAASIALAQNDIKKVLAYSTISQLGYMMLSLGVGAADVTGQSHGYQAGMMHLSTHAMFKACLFLCSGSVIHAMHQALHHVHSHEDAQDMRNMGGLFNPTATYGFWQTLFVLPFMPVLAWFKPKYRDAWADARMPMTFWTMLVATVAISGVPLFSGFISKDAILGGTLHFFAAAEDDMQRLQALPLVIFGFGAAFLTAFYMFRLIYMTFFGTPRLPEGAFEHVHESPKVMTVPLGALAILSFWFVFSADPTGLGSHGWFFHKVKQPERMAVQVPAAKGHTKAEPGFGGLLPLASAEEKAPAETQPTPPPPDATGAKPAGEGQTGPAQPAPAAGKAPDEGIKEPEPGHGPAPAPPPGEHRAKYGFDLSHSVHLLALVASIVIAFSGIRMSRNWYALRRGEPAKLMAERHPWLYDRVLHKYYCDEYYDKLVVKPGLSTARFSYDFDCSVIDWFVNICGVVTVLISQVKGIFDDYVVDALVNAVGFVTKLLGDIARKLQTGLVQNYLAYIVLLVAVAIVLIQLAG